MALNFRPMARSPFGPRPRGRWLGSKITAIARFNRAIAPRFPKKSKHPAPRSPIARTMLRGRSTPRHNSGRCLCSAICVGQLNLRWAIGC